MTNIKEKKFIFISGLHRSGTSWLFRLLKKQENISGFSNIGYPEDEGQFIQNIFPNSGKLINPGRFSFYTKMHFTEQSDISKQGNEIYNNWAKYWDLSKDYLVEKSPPNLIRMRLLQKMFPNSYFITIIRHPIAVSYATKKWTNDRFLSILIKHWIYAHKIYLEDRKYIKNELCITYEEIKPNAQNIIDKLNSFLGTEIIYSEKFINKNQFYFDLWNNEYFKGLKAILKNLEKKYLILKYEKELNNFGYSLIDLEYNNFTNSKYFTN